MKLVQLLAELKLERGSAQDIDVNDTAAKALDKAKYRKLLDRLYYLTAQSASITVDQGTFKLLKQAIESETEVVDHVGEWSVLRSVEGKRVDYFLANLASPKLFTDMLAGYISGDRELRTGWAGRQFDWQFLVVKWSGIHKDKRGLGLGKALYGSVLKFEQSLWSDDQLYAGSHAIWMRSLIPLAAWSGGIVPVNLDKQDIAHIPIKLSDDELKPSNPIKKQISGYAVSLNPPPLVKKLAHNQGNLTLSNYEFMLASVQASINKAIIKGNWIQGQKPITFDDLVDRSESIQQLMRTLDSTSLSGNINFQDEAVKVTQNTKTVLFIFNDALAIVKDLGGSLSLTLI